jgi:16S rRNA (guanine966-N2)-methyltransferase
MRIISGKLKGKSLSFLKSDTTRPLKDSVKENIFNIIIHSNLINLSLENSNILDLYSGIGSFGLECMSRGASKITFVEMDNKVTQVLNENLLNLSLKDKTVVVNDKIENFLKDCNEQKFDIIFFDPPFAEKNYLEELKLLGKKKIYSKNHIVIIHREKDTIDNFEKIIEPFIIKKYGRSKIIFARFLI